MSTQEAIALYRSESKAAQQRPVRRTAQGVRFAPGADAVRQPLDGTGAYLVLPAPPAQ
ncbi:MAG: hypothetical protein H3C62_00800 [Gemmatimonadaceae bacterium]|nr:hypothetical protein [Gemmatimonadaceae bacterium]